MQSPDEDTTNPQQEIQEIFSYLQDEGGYSKADIAAHIGVSSRALEYVLAGQRSGKNMLAPLRKMADGLSAHIEKENAKQARRAEENIPFQQEQDALDHASQQRINELQAITRAFQRQAREEAAEEEIVVSAYRMLGVPRPTDGWAALFLPMLDRQMVQQAAQRLAHQAAGQSRLQLPASRGRPFHQIPAPNRTALPATTEKSARPLLPAPARTTPLQASIRELSPDEDAALRQASFYAILDQERSR